MSKNWQPRTKTERQSTYDIQQKHEADRRHPPVRLDDPSPEELRSCITDGHCWWCGRTGFKSLGVHTSMAHGITAAMIRDLAGLFKHNPVCSPDFSTACRIRNISHPELYSHLQQLHRSKGYKLSFSKAGRIYQDTVRAEWGRTSAAKGQETIARQRREGRYFGKPRKPHHCPGCGTLLPTAFPITCSPECRRIVRQRTAKLSSQIRVERMAKSPSYREWIHQVCSDGARKRVKMRILAKASA